MAPDPPGLAYRPQLTFPEAMSVLQGLLGERVNVSIGGEREGSPAALMQVTGVLDSGWDEEVARENGVRDVVMFHFVDQPYSGFFADVRATARAASVSTASSSRSSSPGSP